MIDQTEFNVGDLVQVAQICDDWGYYMGGDVGVVIERCTEDWGDSMYRIDFNDQGCHVIGDGQWYVANKYLTLVSV